MEPIQFGNWLVTDKEIKWVGQPHVDYYIERARIDEPGPGDRSRMYDWLVHIPTKTWCTPADVYALNTAFIFALEAYGVGFSEELSLVETLIEQKKEMSRR